MSQPRVIARAAWLALGAATFGNPDPKTWLFKCPSCGHVQGWAAWEAAGEEDPASVLGFSCIGTARQSPNVVQIGERDRGAGCMFAGAVDQLGLIPNFVKAGETTKGLPVGDFVFDFAPPKR